MPVVSIADLSVLQKTPSNIRNICILAHVDHGKTTLADCLIASNGVISNRLAGKLRYLDSREDEQKRGITMKSSAISLLHTKENEKYLINLIDSPGHVDFSSEVSTAVRLCDGALVLVDVVEGVCPQTHAVLRQAWLENVKPCLVLNKIDRLITQLKMSPLEAYLHLQQILEQVNVITATLFTSDVMAKTASSSTPEVVNSSDAADQTYDWSSGLDEADDSTLYFCPDQGNVVFASAIDGWAFGIAQFAQLYSQKVGISYNVLNKTLWGDFYLNTKAKRIMKGASAKAKKPLFVQLILENLWNVYETVLERRDKEKTEKILASLKLTVPARDTKYTDARTYLQAIMKLWLPLSRATLDMVCGVLPSPLDLSAEKVRKLLSGDSFSSFESYSDETKNLYEALKSCSCSRSDPIIGFVSKMFSVSQETLPKYRRRPLTEEELRIRRAKARERHAQRTEGKEAIHAEEEQQDSAKLQDTKSADNVPNDEEQAAASETFIAFARIFSGTVRKGDSLFVLGPKYNPRKYTAVQSLEQITESALNLNSGLNNEGDSDTSESFGSFTVSEFKIENLYLMMGREFEELDEVPAGNVLGINGLADHVLKSATISSTLVCPSFTPMPFEAKPIVRVAVEPEQPSALPALRRGLKLLNQADPCVEVFVQETGEYVISVAGEVHLKKCLDDLRQLYAGIELSVSAPIIPFRETIVPPPKIDMVNEEISTDDHRDNIQRLPTYMQREIQDWAEMIQKSTSQGKVEEELDSEKGREWSSKEGRKTKYSDGLIEARTANGQCVLSVRAIPLPERVVSVLEDNAELIKTIVDISSVPSLEERKERARQLRAETYSSLQSFYASLKTTFDESGSDWKDAVRRIWSFGPRRIGPNILLNRVHDYDRPSIWCGLLPDDDKACSTEALPFRSYDNSIVSGFQLASVSGPMCEEPMMGLCFCIEQWSYGGERKDDERLVAGTPSSASLTAVTENASKDTSKTDLECVETGRTVSEATAKEKDNLGSSESQGTIEKLTGGCLASPRESNLANQDVYGPLSGQIISSMKEVCRRAFMAQPMRLMAAMYSCDIQATSDVLGKMYAVINKREGRITKEEMKEGSDIFQVTAVLPVAESFGFAEEIRKKTSGLASPLLYFSHWEVISVDPFWKPTTEEEYLLYGEKADSENQALKYVNSVRKRKGLYIEQKTVEHAEKQRTLKKNK